MLFPFQGPSLFDKSKAAHPDFAVVGIPFDSSVTFRSGARMGPAAVREASKMLTDGDHPLFGTSPACRDVGDITISPDISKNLRNIGDWYAKRQAGDAIPYAIGGDHSITLGALRGLKAAGLLPDDAAIVHFDAHCDTWAYNIDPTEAFGHGTWVYNAVTEQLVDPKNIVQVGIRSPVDVETRDWLANLGGTVLDHRWIRRRTLSEISWAIENVVRERPFYLSIDIDVLDPAYAPGTGTPECGGFTTRELLTLLEELNLRGLVGTDLVEINPSYDYGGVTSLAGATIMWTIMSSFRAMLGGRS